MKTISYKILMLLLMLPCIAIAGNGVKGKYTKEKKINKVYLVNSDAGLRVDNKYGSVYVTTWDENKTAVDIVISVSGNNEDKVDKKLSSIDIDFEALKSLISMRTRIGTSIGSNNLSMEINYTIKIPKKGSIDLNNQYGPIIAGKIYGKSQIRCQYGDVTIDELNNEVNALNFQYSSEVKINYTKNGDVNAQYSNLNLVKAGNLKIKGQYTDFILGDVNDLTYRTEYGDLNLKKGGKITGSADYSDLKFGYISGIFNTTCNYGEVKIGSTDKAVKNIAINATYSNIAINYNEQMPFDFEFNIEYGDLSGSSSSFKFSEKKERNTSSYYKGYYKTSGTNKMYIKSQYGDIYLTKS